MKIAEPGTRARLMLAMLGLYVLLSAAYAWAVFAVIERLEYELTHNVVNRELQEFASTWAVDRNTPVPNAMGLAGYVEGRDDAQMPIVLRNLAPGLYDEIKIGDAEDVVDQSAEPGDGEETPGSMGDDAVRRAIAYYQGASYRYHHRLDRESEPAASAMSAHLAARPANLLKQRPEQRTQ